MTTCGEFGGQRRTNGIGPCSQVAGWGTDHLGEGCCRDHEGDARRRDKEKFLAALGDGTPIGEIAEAIDVVPSTLWRWRQADPDFKAAADALLEGAEETRLRRVEETIFERILKGEVGQTLTIFWLVNTAARLARETGRPQRWEHLMKLEATIGGTLTLIPAGALALARERVEEMEGEEDFQPLGLLQAGD